jgi:hypothetical protein
MERWELEADLDYFTLTGEWVDNVTPEWAREEAALRGCDPKDHRVIVAGYKKLVLMLHTELVIAGDRAEVPGRGW